ncbi:rRNA maturation RNase YbeY [Riemerella anatipestifer]|nr:rRNA maturation RNase YbeY [Riemerella anatipestifer]MDY3532739.1 rRNA maturation RNase YbeY [Riemerella anatipestifer]MDY3534706.1 rRNA maturation RNase YbeY [Riemerella anatipestifer]
MIQFFFEEIEPISISTDISKWLEQIILSEQKKLGKINYIFCDDEYLLKINQEHLQHDYYTDIITFDYVRGNTISGDIFVSVERVKDNASTLSKDYQSEFLRVLAHGVLHLCGYKDKTEEDIKTMRGKEDFYLSKTTLAPR